MHIEQKQRKKKQEKQNPNNSKCISHGCHSLSMSASVCPSSFLFLLFGDCCFISKNGNILQLLVMMRKTEFIFIHSSRLTSVCPSVCVYECVYIYFYGECAASQSAAKAEGTMFSKKKYIYKPKGKRTFDDMTSCIVVRLFNDLSCTEPGNFWKIGHIFVFFFGKIFREMPVFIYRAKK